MRKEDFNDPVMMGMKIFKLLEANKILLLQDKLFPSIVTGVIGKKIAGSWWGHPLANPIYNGLQWLEQNRPVLSIKLLEGKVTYLHESLFSDICSIVCERRNWQVKRLQEDELHLLKYISVRGKVTSDDQHLSRFSKDLKKSLVNLEKRLLIFSTEKHTTSGKHIKVYMTWKRSKLFIPKEKDYLKSKNHIENIVYKLNKQSGASVKLPW